MEHTVPSGVRISTVDSALGTWTSAHWSPERGDLLHDVLDSVWYFEGRTTYARERVFPDGLSELIVHLDDVYKDADDGSSPFPITCINGVRTRASVVEAPGTHCRVVGMRFTPHGAFAAMARPIEDLLDITVDVRELIGTDGNSLVAQCTVASRCGPGAVIGAALEWLMRRLARARFPEPFVPWAAGIIRAQRGDVSLDELRSHTGFSRSRFAEVFRRHLGVTPKRYARIVRFHHTLSLLGSGETLVGAADAMGYYDQPHMYRDFCEFAGMTPAAFLKATRYPESVSLADS